MDKLIIKNQLLAVFNENGLNIANMEETTALELDSLQTIALIVCIENEFDIEIPDEYISGDILISFEDYYELLIVLLK